MTGTNSRKKRRLNKVNMNLLLSALDPKRKDIIVTEICGRYDSSPKEWHVKNAQGQEIFSLKSENVTHDDERFEIQSRLLTLQINGVSIVVDTEYYGDAGWDTMIFLDTDLREALDAKLCVQNKEQQLQDALKHMSAQDKMIKNIWKTHCKNKKRPGGRFFMNI